MEFESDPVPRFTQSCADRLEELVGGTALEWSDAQHCMETTQLPDEWLKCVDRKTGLPPVVDPDAKLIEYCERSDRIAGKEYASVFERQGEIEGCVGVLKFLRDNDPQTFEHFTGCLEGRDEAEIFDCLSRPSSAGSPTPEWGPSRDLSGVPSPSTWRG
jgi:hypothetical protein